MVKSVSISDFNDEINKASGLVLVDFWATWCGPCKMLSPIIDETSEKINDVKFLKVNVDDEPELATKYGIQSIPTLVFIKNNVVNDMSIGYISAEELEKKIKENK